MSNRWMRRGAALMAAMVLALGAGCAAGASTPEVAPVPANGEQGKPQNPQDGTDDRMVIRTKTLRLEVSETGAAMDAVRERTRARGGTVSEMRVATEGDGGIYRTPQDGSGDGALLRGWITVRIPTAAYEDFVKDVTGIGTVKYQAETATDVTEQHVDLSARLKNFQAQEVKLREFFDAAKDVKDMLAIEAELARVRGEIESMDAQVKSLERQAAMATVTVELAMPQPLTPTGSWGFGEPIADGLRGAASLLGGLLTTIIATAPIWLLGLLLFFPIRSWRRRRRANAPQPALVPLFPQPMASPSDQRAAWPADEAPPAPGDGERAAEAVESSDSPSEPVEK